MSETVGENPESSRGGDARDLEFLPMFGLQTPNHAINLHKLLTPVVIILFAYFFKNFSVPVICYFSCHSTYCLLWLTKYALYPNKSFNQIIPWYACLLTFLFLGGYWLIPFSMIYLSDIRDLPLWHLGICLSVCILGTTLQAVSDAMIFAHLRQKRTLYTEGMNLRTRNPGYLGEIILYMGFCLYCNHWLPWVVCLSYWLILFVPNIYKKEKSMSRYPEWEEYCKRSWVLIPKPWPLPRFFC